VVVGSFPARDVPPKYCCAAVAQGPDGEQRRRQQRPGDDRGGGRCPRRSAGSKCGCLATWGTRLGYSGGCSLIAGCCTVVPQQHWPLKSTSAGVCVWTRWWGNTGRRTGRSRRAGWRQSSPWAWAWAWAATRREELYGQKGGVPGVPGNALGGQPQEESLQGVHDYLQGGRRLDDREQAEFLRHRAIEGEGSARRADESGSAAEWIPVALEYGVLSSPR